LLFTDKPQPVTQTLIHGDFTIDNVLVHDGEISGVIDWSEGAFGDSRCDAALAIRPKPNVFQDYLDVDIFFEGYGEKILTDDDFTYFAEGFYEFF
jgi:aminoglycoside phosphotransferase (APT) family kinase protein